MNVSVLLVKMEADALMESMDMFVTVLRAMSNVTVELTQMNVLVIPVKMVQHAMTKSMVTTVHVLQDMLVGPAGSF